MPEKNILPVPSVRLISKEGVLSHNISTVLSLLNEWVVSLACLRG